MEMGSPHSLDTLQRTPAQEPGAAGAVTWVKYRHVERHLTPCERPACVSGNARMGL